MMKIFLPTIRWREFRPAILSGTKRSRLIRVGIAAASFSMVAVLCALMDFGDRGVHFHPDRYASNVLTPGAEEYDLSRLRVLTRCMSYVRTNYVDPKRYDAREMFASAMDRVEREVPEILIEWVQDAEGKPTQAHIHVGSSEKDYSIQSVGNLHQLNWKLLDVFAFIAKNLSESTDPREVEFAAIKGLLSVLDPHSLFLEPAIYREMKVGTTGRFGGLGIVIGAKDGKLVIQRVLDGTPAHNARLRSGDHIVQVESESTVNMPLSEAVKRLRGLPGSPVVLWIQRKGVSEHLRFRIIRANIILDSVTSSLSDNGVATVHLKNFQQSTGKELASALSQVNQQWYRKSRESLRGLILDLRDNPGGLLDQAVSVSDLFLESGIIVATVGSGSRIREERVASRQGTFRSIPIVVLVNSGSASASEIVAGALKNSDRAIILGQQTWGKGSVQVLYEIGDAALKLTVAQYLTPGEESIQGVGITPHVALVPVTVSKDVSDLGVHRPGGEGALENSLKGQEGPPQQAPFIRIPHLNLPVDEQAESDSENASETEGEDDFAHSLAQRILLDAGRPSAKEFLARSKPVFAIAEREQLGDLVEAMGRLDVDWNAGANPRKPSLQLELATDREGGPVVAGETFKLTLRATNTGKRAVHRIRVSTESSIGVMDERDFLIGRIPAGETRTWSVPVKLSKGLSNQSPRVTAHAYYDRSQDPITGVSPAILHIPIQSIPHPRFGYTMQLIDLVGNGDGVANPGEKIKLRIRVHNVGEGAAQKVKASLVNRGADEVFITKGRMELTSLGPQETADLEFDIEVREQAVTSGLQLELVLQDSVLGHRFVHDLSVPIEQRPERTLVERFFRWAGQKDVLLMRAGASSSASVLSSIPANVPFVSDAELGKWVRVPVVEYGYGWVLSEQLLAAERSVRIPKAVKTKIRPQVVQPRIDFETPLQQIVRSPTFRLRGHALFPQIEPKASLDLMVFHEHDKVLYKHGTAEDESLEFNTDINLQEGMNHITIRARVGNKLISKRRIRVYRQ